MSRNNNNHIQLSHLTTEQPAPYSQLHKLPIRTLLKIINHEDHFVPCAVAKALPQIEKLTKAVETKLKQGGRLIYIGTGTSGRLGVLDAAECPPTFGVPPGLVIGIIAGGDKALKGPVEFAEDNPTQGWKDLLAHNISRKDIVIGISASGRTPYTVGALKKAKEHGITTGCITCNRNVPILNYSDFPVIIDVGPEVIRGSTRMKAGTAQKLVLNMISTTVMTRLGHVYDKEMIDLKPLNSKLLERGAQIISQFTGIPLNEARKLLLETGSVRKAIQAIIKNTSK